MYSRGSGVVFKRVYVSDYRNKTLSLKKTRKIHGGP